MHLTFEKIFNAYSGSLKTGIFQNVYTGIANDRNESRHAKTIKISGKGVAILSKDTGFSEQCMTDELSKANFRYLNISNLDIDIKHKWDWMTLKYLIENAKIILVEPKNYLAKTIGDLRNGDLKYEDRLNSFFVDRNPGNQNTVHPIFSDDNIFNPETLAKYGWEHFPAPFETEDEAKSSSFYQGFLKYIELGNSGLLGSFVFRLAEASIIAKLLSKFKQGKTIESLCIYFKIKNNPEYLLKILTAKDMIVPSFSPSKSFFKVSDTVSIPDNAVVPSLDPDGVSKLIKKGKKIQDSEIFTQKNKSSAAAVVKLTGRQTYILTPEENQSEFDFETLPVSELFDGYQKTWHEYIAAIYPEDSKYPEDLDSHALHILRAMITETDMNMKTMSDFINKLPLTIKLENNKKFENCVNELKDGMIEFQSLYQELLLQIEHFDFYQTVCKLLIAKFEAKFEAKEAKKDKEDKKLLDESQEVASDKSQQDAFQSLLSLSDTLSSLEDTLSSLEDTFRLRELKSKLNKSSNLVKKINETRLKIGLQAALLEPLLVHFSDRLFAIKCSGELGADAFQKDKQFELLHKQAHHLQYLITKTKPPIADRNQKVEGNVEV